MIIGIGTDLAKVSRLESSLERLGDRFAERILAPIEMAEYRGHARPARLLAKRFAVKEAAAKALGTGIGKVSWHDIYIEHDEMGAPILCFQGHARVLADQKAISHLHVSISDEDDLALAFVVLS
ncbi:holo-ACP synthase [Deltaproteobacteria bacterium]|nr:holo-ACP synthase [Deltaproteobacteria bacterium]